jgi:hypothetical protein
MLKEFPVDRSSPKAALFLFFSLYLIFYFSLFFFSLFKKKGEADAEVKMRKYSCQGSCFTY